MKPKVAVVFGGKSSEHEVSLRSAKSVMNAINQSQFEIVPVGITKKGEWVFHPQAHAILIGLCNQKMLPAEFLAENPPAHIAITATKLPNPADFTDIDVVFPVIHGPNGEDGTIQGLLEIGDLPYVGTGILASSVGMDKIVFKDVMKANGIPVAPYWHCLRKDWEANPEAQIQAIEEKLGYPVFTKPPNMGSSVGIKKCDNQEELRDGMNTAARYDRKILVEAAVPNTREIEISVLGNDTPQASVAGEIIPNHEFYDYEAKYLGTATSESKTLIPADLSPDEMAEIQALAVRTFKAIDGSGLSRVDFLMNRESKEVFINEVNTMPGFTSISMYPKMWEASGLAYTDLISRLIELAIERHQERAKNEI